MMWYVDCSAFVDWVWQTAFWFGFAVGIGAGIVVGIAIEWRLIHSILVGEEQEDE